MPNVACQNDVLCLVRLSISPCSHYCDAGFLFSQKHCRFLHLGQPHIENAAAAS